MTFARLLHLLCNILVFVPLAALIGDRVTDRNRSPTPSFSLRFDWGDVRGAVHSVGSFMRVSPCSNINCPGQTQLPRNHCHFARGSCVALACPPNSHDRMLSGQLQLPGVRLRTVIVDMH